jgi:L-iditol 2-dehydrogenase
MRVAMYYTNRDIRLEEMPTPKIGPGEILVKVEASGICGSDTMEWYRRGRAPLVLGHEIGGQVVKVGDGVTCFKVRDRVTADHHVPCDTCKYCLAGHETMCETLRKTNFDPGGFAEYIRLPKINVERGTFLLPDEISYEEATFIEPLACVLRGQRQAGLKPGMSVLVLGSGIAGLLHVKLAKALGAGRIIATDLNDYRLDAAKRFGAEAVIKATDDVPATVKKVNGGFLADVVILCTGAVPAIKQAFQSVERGGTILLFAPTDEGVILPVSLNDIFWRRDVTLTTTYAGSPADYATVMELIRAGRVQVKDMITHRLPLKDAGLGFKLVAEAKDSIKVILMPQK